MGVKTFLDGEAGWRRRSKLGMRSDRQGRGRKRDDGRHRKRHESHQKSHAQDPGKRLGPIADHPLVSQDPPAVVETAEDLTRMIDHLAAAGSFAFDSEFIGERNYRPILCLAHSATTERVFVIDPLGGLDLSGLWELIVCPTVEKIVLAGRQDFIPAVLHTHRPPANIMDVQIAAGFVHTDYPLSLTRLVAEFVGVSLGGTMAFSHWDRRPLSAMQVRYAADDVRYLPAARAAIGEQLAKLGRCDWARQECADALENISLYDPAPEALYLRVRGRDRLGRRQLAVLRKLAIWRDRAARREDVPTRTLVRDGVLIALARQSLTQPVDPSGIRGMPRPVVSRYGAKIIQAVAKALALPGSQLPNPEPTAKPTPGDQEKKLWAAINEFCPRHSIATSLVATRKQVTQVCREALTGQPPTQPGLRHGWRGEFLADLLPPETSKRTS